MAIFIRVKCSICVATLSKSTRKHNIKQYSYVLNYFVENFTWVAANDKNCQSNAGFSSGFFKTQINKRCDANAATCNCKLNWLVPSILFTISFQPKWLKSEC